MNLPFYCGTPLTRNDGAELVRAVGNCACASMFESLDAGGNSEIEIPPPFFFKSIYMETVT